MTTTIEAKYVGDTDGQLVNDQVYQVSIQNMIGKLYDKEKHEYSDDHRIMLWIQESFTRVLFFKVYPNEDEIYRIFKIVQ